MRAIDRFLPAKKVTQPEYWHGLKDDPRIKALRAQRCLSLQRLSQELALKASEVEAKDPDLVIEEYRLEYGLTQESRWKPKSQWQHLIP